MMKDLLTNCSANVITCCVTHLYVQIIFRHAEPGLHDLQYKTRVFISNGEATPIKTGVFISNGAATPTKTRVFIFIGAATPIKTGVFMWYGAATIIIKTQFSILAVADSRFYSTRVQRNGSPIVTLQPVHKSIPHN